MDLKAREMMSLATDLFRVNRVSSKSAVRLQEIGPRMTLQLMKIEEGLCSGEVIFNENGILVLQLSRKLRTKKKEMRRHQTKKVMKKKMMKKQKKGMISGCSL